MSGLPSFETLLKSRDVEDPVNLWMHRPLAYLFVKATYKTPLTPNQITLLAMLVGVLAGVFFIIGTPAFLISGGILLWSSSILDGADGILARAKNMGSEIGRALDGTADGIVAGATVFAVVYHLWSSHHSWFEMLLVLIAIPSALIQIYLYDYYKEIFLRATGDGDGERKETIESLTDLRQRKKAEGAPFIVSFAIGTNIALLKNQAKLIRLLDPKSNLLVGLNLQSYKKRFRELNLGPMKLWALISLCPHTYMMAIAAIFQRLDLYLWYRIVIGNTLFISAVLWQRYATSKMLEEVNVDSAQYTQKEKLSNSSI